MSETSPAVTPNWVWLKSSWHHMIGFGFGSGLASTAPGTWGSLAAFPIYWFSCIWAMPIVMQFIVFIGLFAYGCYAADQCGKALGEVDHKGIVIDEIWAMMVLLTIFPSDVLSQLLIFASFRFFDIKKPYPIKIIENRHKNGFGVMADDAMAAVYAAIVVQIVLKIIQAVDGL